MLALQACTSYPPACALAPVAASTPAKIRTTQCRMSASSGFLTTRSHQGVNSPPPSAGTVAALAGAEVLPTAPGVNSVAPVGTGDAAGRDFEELAAGARALRTDRFGAG